MMLADQGADVLTIERAGAVPYAPGLDASKDMLRRGRRSLALDLKSEAGRQTALDLASSCDVLLEGYRPGVMERLGLGPDPCLAANPKLVYARMTGWGQTGPLALKAGHDINYLAMSGSLWLCGRADEVPSPNLNLVADMGGGGMMMAFGILCALVEARQSGQGQVVDTAMVEGAALLAASVHGFRAMGMWEDRRGVNLIDGGAPFYEVYETADGGFMAVGALEPQFFAALLQGLGIDPAEMPNQHDSSGWPAMRERFASRFRSQSRAHWEAVFDALDACTTPVLSPDEAARHPHMRARSAFAVVDGTPQPMPAPKFSRTPGAVAGPPPGNDLGGRALAEQWGVALPGASAAAPSAG